MELEPSDQFDKEMEKAEGKLRDFAASIRSPVHQLLSDPNKWDRERDCSTNKNRLTSPESELAVRWSVRAAVEKCYPDDWKNKMRHFMQVAAKHYPSFENYNQLHSVLSHEAMIYIVKESQL